MGHITVIARVARDLWQRKQTLSSGFALGLGSFTAINPWPRAITITNIIHRPEEALDIQSELLLVNHRRRKQI